MTGRKRTRTEERAYAELESQLGLLAKLELMERTRFERLKFEQIPAAWSTIEEKVPTRPKKVRIHTSLDADVAGFYRAMGQGYQARMNAVLRAYMLTLQSREIPSRKNKDWMGNEI